MLAAAGLASRREAERWIADGRVEVNGQVVRELGSRADPARDAIRVDGQRIGRPRPRRSYLVYKPRGVVTTTRDPHAKRTVLELLPRPAKAEGSLFPVGRLDAASEGLLLITNDGELAHALLHPSFEVPRTYRVSVDGAVRAEALRRLRDGITIEGRRTEPSEVVLIGRQEARSVIEVTLREGRRHQIRKMLLAVGHPVRRLVRVRFGPLRLRGLRTGDWRRLTPAEERALDQLGADPSRTRSRRSKGTRTKA